MKECFKRLEIIKTNEGKMGIFQSHNLELSQFLKTVAEEQKFCVSFLQTARVCSLQHLFLAQIRQTTKQQTRSLERNENKQTNKQTNNINKKIRSSEEKKKKREKILTAKQQARSSDEREVDLRVG